MASRRILYGTLLFCTLVLHVAYGQYITHYVLLFLLCLPVLTFFVSLPAMLSASATLSGGEDVERGHACRMQLHIVSKRFLPPEAITLTLESQNLFTDRQPTVEKLRFFGVRDAERIFELDADRLGTVRYRIRKARVCDCLGLISIPMKSGGAVTLTVLPKALPPHPDPELKKASDRFLKPKPLGFSEEHELRPYREGDAVNLIHWKLSQKYDEPIVREPQEMERRNIVLSVDLPEPYEEQQSVLEQLRFLSDALLKTDTPYVLCFGRTTVCISSESEFDRFLRNVLSEPMTAQAALPTQGGSDTLVYRILPYGEGSV